ncbi:MAG TPA: helix-turn-helix domain-containing protein, partial [Solirubrobacterales bacterium]|nr:helix-turn-helix domain-containing protein [Solirubrobacterales bacterium]
CVPVLRDIVDNLGGTLLEVLAAPQGLEVEVTGIAVHDSQEPPEVMAGQVVAGVGLAAGREASILVATLGSAGAAALVLKEGVAGPALIEDAAAAGVALLAVPAGTAWGQLILLVSSVISRASFGGSTERLAGADAGDLFAVANVVAELVDAPITIEDPWSRVIAFSSRQEEADDARAETILGRQVPAPWLRRLQELGIFQRLLKERGPIYVDQLPDVMPRVAIAIRAGDEVLGSIWAAVKGPFSEERERALVDAANFVSLHMLRHRLASDTQSGLEAELVVTMLKGGPLAGDAARRLGLRGPLRVLAVGGHDGEGDLDFSVHRIRDLVSLHVSPPQRRAPTASVGGIVYAVVPVAARGEGSTQALREAADRVLERARALLKSELVAAIGSAADDVGGLPASRETADQVLRVLRSNGIERRVADLSDVRASALVLRFADAVAGDPALATGPLARLTAHDEQRHTAFVPTLRAYLDSFGDVETTARRLGVHPNTVRYRLKQLQSVSGIDLEDSSERLVLLLELQLAPAPTA